jgi:hypothetical protein
MNIEQFFHDAKSHFQVKDIRTSTSKILFILESPHKEELKNGVPLAGLSGRSMAKELFQVKETEAIGKYLAKQTKTIYSIINVCPFPLQASAYPDEFVLQYKEELLVAESIRTSSAKSFRDTDKSTFHNMLIKDFKSRLLEGITKDAIIVPCGKFADKYVKELLLANEYEIIDGVPHPSYNSWARPKYKEVIETIRRNGQQLIV